MIKEIKITNFYSFREETISLQPDVNILVGINGSGKSNFFRAIRLLKEGVAGKGLRAHIFDDLGGFDNIFFKGERENDEIELEYTLDNDIITKGNYGFQFTSDIIYRLAIIKTGAFQNFYVREYLIINEHVYLNFENGKGYLRESIKHEKSLGKAIPYGEFNSQDLVLKEISDTERYAAITAIKNVIKDIEVYEYFDTTPRSAIRRPVIATSFKRLIADGANLTQILNTIKINNKRDYKKIVEMLNEVNPDFSGFDYHVIGGSNIELMLDESDLNSSIHVSSMSDGTLRYLCLLAILFNQERGKFICIDEPEIGLHPDMIYNVSKAIKEASKESTIVIATHNDNLLNYYSFENLRVFEKNEMNATQVISFTKSQFEGCYEQFVLGQMWKAGDLGGVRYGA